MDKYKFLNEIITDYILINTLETEIRDTLLLYSHKDDLRVLSNKIKETVPFSKYCFSRIFILFFYKTNIINL